MRLKIFALSLVFVASPLVRADDDELMDLMGKQVITDESTGEDAKAVAPSMIKKLLPKPTAEQNIFVGFFSAGDFEKALYQWPSAFEGSTFAKTVRAAAGAGIVHATDTSCSSEDFSQPEIVTV